MLASGRNKTVVVCGAGAAGMAASIAAARRGCRVYLVESSPSVGGTVTKTLIHTLGGLFDARGEFLNGGLAREMAEALAGADRSVEKRRIGRAWVLNVDPEIYRAVVLGLLAREPKIEIIHSAAIQTITTSGRRVETLAVEGPQGQRALFTDALIDATGSAAAVRQIDPGLSQTDPAPAAAGLVLVLSGVEPGAVQFPRNLGAVRALDAAEASGRFPAGFGRAWIDKGAYADEVYVKVSLDESWTLCREGAKAAVASAVNDYRDAALQTLRKLPGFASAVCRKTGEPGIRDGGRIRGEYCLTGQDVRSARRFEDAVCRCSWPIEYWDARRGVSVEYLPGDQPYEIPLRCLKVKGWLNVWSAGKSLSADKEAQASARVVGCCWSMGESAGQAACR